MPRSLTSRSPTPAELHAHIPAATRTRRYFPALVLFAADYAGYLAAVSGACLLTTWWGKLACAMGASLAIGALFIIGHDAAHLSFVPSLRVNRWLARFAFFPSFTPLASWMHAHNHLHHRFLRVRHRDMVWQPWSLEEYREQPAWRKVLYRFLRTPPGLSFYWTMHNWLPHHLFPHREALGSNWPRFRFDRLCVVGFLVALFGALQGLMVVAEAWSWATPATSMGILCWGIVVPYLLWSYLIGFVDLVQHTHPRSIWFGDEGEWDYVTATLRSSTHIILPWGLNRLWHNILVHTAHHVDPRVPLYQLSPAQGRLEEAYPQDVLVERFTPSYLFRLFGVCRLYDFERRQWLDYDGTPTAPAQRGGEDYVGHKSSHDERPPRK
jgi:acyl-lipid omega-6 desaturase (Delta-12 desaturase)